MCKSRAVQHALLVRRGRENLSRTSGGCLAWIIRVRRRKSGKAGDPCHGPWALVEPRDNAIDIDGGGRGHVLQVGLGYTRMVKKFMRLRAHSISAAPQAVRDIELGLRGLALG